MGGREDKGKIRNKTEGGREGNGEVGKRTARSRASSGSDWKRRTQSSCIRPLTHSNTHYIYIFIYILLHCKHFAIHLYRLPVNITKIFTIIHREKHECINSCAMCIGACIY